MELSLGSASSLASSGAKKVNTKYWTNCVRTTTTQLDSMAEALPIQVSTLTFDILFKLSLKMVILWTCSLMASTKNSALSV